MSFIEDRQPWLQKARKQHYRTIAEWVEALKGLGWEGINASTVGNWEASGFLPTSLDFRAINLVSDSLKMTPNQVLKLQGVKIVERFEDMTVPAVAVDFVQEIIGTDKAILDEIMPVIEQQFRVLRDFMQKHRNS